MTQASTWQPNYRITTAIAARLMEIEAVRVVVEHTPLAPAAEAELRRQVRLRSTHYSTRIEGNRLTLAEAAEAIALKRARFLGRERDTGEVRNYWNALLRVEEWAARKAPVTEELLRRLHALVEHGTRARPTSYREGQNVIRDAASGAIVYLPPEAADVPSLMAELVRWINQAEAEGAPAPVIAGLAHYQFVTIHPYYDGNGRTGRLMATFLLHRGGYGLNGFYSLEEEHARDLAGYYGALSVHPHHNYYEGRAEADLTLWLDYFTTTLAHVFTLAQSEARRGAGEGMALEPELLRGLDPRARAVLPLFARTDRITTADVVACLGLSERTCRMLCSEWVRQGFLEATTTARKNRGYRLSAKYRQYMGNALTDEEHP
jgi:Fic family protein